MSAQRPAAETPFILPETAADQLCYGGVFLPLKGKESQISQGFQGHSRLNGQDPDIFSSCGLQATIA